MKAATPPTRADLIRRRQFLKTITRGGVADVTYLQHRIDQERVRYVASRATSAPLANPRNQGGPQ